MKTPIALLMAGTLLLTSCVLRVSGEKDRKFKVSENEFSFVQTYKTIQPDTLKITTSGGNIRTSGYEGNTIEVSFVVTKYGKVIEITLEELKEIAQVEIFNDKSKLEINISNISIRNVSVGFNIKTPFKTTANLNTSGGNISISGLSGNQDINTSGGNLNIKAITGDVIANTSGGNIDLENLTGKINATTSGGNIHANDLKPELQANTSGGNIDITNIEGLVDASTSGGSINLDQMSGTIKANTSGGNISATITKPVEKLELETSGGNIDCTVPQGLGLNLELSADHIETQLVNFNGKYEKDKISGKINGGGIPVNLTTYGGSINLNYK